MSDQPDKTANWARSPGGKRVIIIVASFIAILAVFYLVVLAGLPGADAIKNFRPESTGNQNTLEWPDTPLEYPVRIWVPLSKISPLLQKAVVISEDDLFYQHKGVNFDLMVEAFKVNWQKKRYVRGASTITMQLARNAFLHKRKTILRKFRELIVAKRLEKHLSKNQILELYLNVIEWGENLYGAEAASRYYFGKPAAQLDLSEATMLAGIIPNPRYFNPFKRLQSCQRMQKRVLWLMQISKLITAEQAQFVLASADDIQSELHAEKSAEIDSFEEARYMLEDSTQLSFSLPKSNPMAYDEEAQQDSLISEDSTSVKVSEDSLDIEHSSESESLP